MSERTHRFTRQELYELVWSEPMVQLAKKFGLSDVGLSKACRRIAIPVPERGYWARRQAGKQTQQRPLPPRGPGMPDSAEIGANASSTYGTRLDPLVNEATLSPPTFSEAVSDLTARVRQIVGKVAAPKTLAQPHRLIARLLEEDERRREKQQSTPYPVSWEIPIFNSSFERRRLRILNALFHALERCGMKPSVQGREARELSVRVGEQHVSFSLDGTAKRSQASRSPSSQGKSSLERLRLQIPAWRNGTEARKSWEDSDGVKIENQLADIVVELIVAGESQYREWLQRRYEWYLEEKARLEEAERRRKEEEERRERERQIQAQKERVERLLNEASALRQADEIRSYVEAVRSANAAASDPLPPEKIEAWATWALSEADRIDPIRSGRFLGQVKV
jgi:hypothetical protein